VKEAPTLETERLILRQFKGADFEATYQNGIDPETARFVGGPVISRTAAWEKFLRGPAMWLILGYGMWIVERRSDGAVLGQIGFADFMREMEPPLADVPEMAWMLGPQARGPDGQGMGYGSEALAAVLAWGDANLGEEFSKFQCIISPENEPSLRLAQKHGFVEQRRADYKDDVVVVFERMV
jgi:RimJ/RimL family protein N-acetyltransferase